MTATDEQSGRRPRRVRCARCDKSIAVPPVGRIPRFCGPSCRQQAYVARKPPAPKAAEVLPPTPEAVEAMRALIRSELWDLLTKAGVVAGPMPPADADADTEAKP